MSRCERWWSHHLETGSGEQGGKHSAHLPLHMTAATKPLATDAWHQQESGLKDETSSVEFFPFCCRNKRGTSIQSFWSLILCLRITQRTAGLLNWCCFFFELMLRNVTRCLFTWKWVTGSSKNRLLTEWTKGKRGFCHNLVTIFRRVEVKIVVMVEKFRNDAGSDTLYFTFD